MKEKFFALYHNATKKFSVHLPSVNEWPSEWNTIEYKTYARLPKRKLPTALTLSPILDILHARRSSTSFTGEPLTLAEWGVLLGSGIGISAKDVSGWKRTYPSAGGMYPLEGYVFILVSTEELPAGVYHYDVREHQLSQLFLGDVSESLLDVYAKDQVGGAAGLIILTAVFERTTQKYGERGYRFCLQEAGHAGQNIVIASHSLNLKSSPITATGEGDGVVEKLLGVDGFAESLVYGISVGR